MVQARATQQHQQGALVAVVFITGEGPATDFTAEWSKEAIARGELGH